MIKKIYVAATRQHKGKTTTTLGLVANLKKQGYNVGYCKPVGQQHITVNGKTADKDAILFGKILDIPVIPEFHSPVILGKGTTADYLDNPTAYNFKEKIDKAATYLEEQHDIVVYEGTGHPGVGSVAGLNNAQVAKQLGAGVIMVAEGGIGSTIDRLDMCLALFREEKVPIIGVVINKVKQNKMEHIQKYLKIWLDSKKIPLLGIVPYDRTLSFPLMTTVCKAVKGNVIFNTHKTYNRVEDILAGSLIALDEFKTFKNLLLVVSYKRYQEAIQKIRAMERLKKLTEPILSGIIITGDGRNDNWFEHTELHDDYITDNEIPVITTSLDTYGSVVKFSRIEVKINTHTLWKVQRAIDLFKQHIELKKLLKE